MCVCVRERERERERKSREREGEREKEECSRITCLYRDCLCARVLLFVWSLSGDCRWKWRARSATHTERACGGSSASNEQSTNKNKQESRLGSIRWSVLEMADPPLRLLNFVSENELEEGREKGVVPRDDLQSFPDRPLFEILKENKDKKDAEFNELLKHRPPKALDEDETEFLDSLEMYKKQQEQELAQEEARELTDFHAAIASRTITAEEPRQLIPTTASTHEAVPGRGKRLSQASVVTSLIRIKSHPKRAKVESSPKEGSNQVLPVQKVDGQQMLGLVSYPDESDEEEQIQ